MSDARDDGATSTGDTTTRCRACGAPIDDVPVDGACPGCGIGATLAVAGGPRCRDCGYDLTSLALGAHCPECALPVLASVDPARAGEAHLDRGATAALFTACVPMIALVAGLLLALGFAGVMLLAVLPIFGGFAGIDAIRRARLAGRRAPGRAIAAIVIGFGSVALGGVALAAAFL